MYYAVIGREDGDDEDTCFLTIAPNEDAAVEEFKKMVRGPHRSMAEVYINYVLESQAIIDIVRSL